MKYIALLQVLLALSTPLLADVYQEKREARIRATYEVIPLTDTIDMGVVGTHLDWYPLDSFKPLYTGIGFLSSMSGEEGGFFTFGYTLGVDYKFYDNFHVDGGVYVSGGAGSYVEFPNGGMLVRSHLALEYETKNVDFVFGLSRTDFPNSRANQENATDIHPFVGINISNDIWTEGIPSNYTYDPTIFDGVFEKIRITPSMLYYDVDNKAVKKERFKGADAYQANFPAIGLQLDKFISDEIFVTFEAYGALSSAAGYAAIQVGTGYDYKITDYLAWESKMIVGSVGDSRIDTGSGLLFQPMTGLVLDVTPSLSLKTLIGRSYAPDGLFSSTTYEVGISVKTDKPVTKKGTYLFPSHSFDNIEWTMTPSLKVYFPYDSKHKATKEESQETISLVGVMFGVPLNDWFSIIGSTHWAMTGNIGSYAEGFFGAKLSSPMFTPLDIKLNVMGEIGAGAGAGVNTKSGGYVTHYTTGLSLPVSKHTDLSLSAGRMATSDGSFQALSVLFALDINLNYIYKK